VPSFNRRWRRLWGGFILLQQAVAQELMTAQDCEVMDCVLVLVAHGARSFHPGWLADIARIGKGGNDRYFYGLRLLLLASASGRVTGWILAAGNIQDRWLAEGMFSARAGCPQVTGPTRSEQAQPRLPAPTDWMGPAQSCGPNTGRPLVIADNGFAAADWQQHWTQAYATRVEAPPETTGRGPGRWFSSLRQVIETVFAHLDVSFGLKYPGAHTTWGLLSRVAAKLAAYNLGIWINRYWGRPDFAFATLIV
jgi:hypothetical protein